jgi:hypothetical protein
LLVITPEQVWTALEDGKFMVASRIYLVAEAAYQDLKNLDHSGDIYLKKYPVYRRQWEVIQPLKSQIIQKAIGTIRNPILSDSAILSALSCLCVLQNSSIPDVFQLFLSHRQQFLFESLSVDLNEAADTLFPVLKRLVDSLLITLAQAERMFCAYDGSSKLEHNLKTILNVGSESGGSVAQFYSENSKMSFLFRFVPMHVRQYAPSVNVKSILQNKDIEEFLNTWNLSLVGRLHERLLLLLSQVNLPPRIALLSSEVFQYAFDCLRTQKSIVFSI